MTRLFGILTLGSAVGIGVLLLLAPDTAAAWLPMPVRLVVSALVASIIGVALTSMLVRAHFAYRFGYLVKAAERIAAGDYTGYVEPRGSSLERRLARAVNDIATALVDTHDRATYDRLTGVANRQSLLAALFNEVERATRYGRPLSVAFVDIDHLKSVNDTYGHAVGDVVLRGVAQTISENLRASDMIGRYGGEEFMLILTETDVEEGSVLTEKLRTLVGRQRFAVEGAPEIAWDATTVAIAAYQVFLGSAFGFWGLLTISRSLPAITTNLLLMAVPVVGLASSIAITDETLTVAVTVS